MSVWLECERNCLVLRETLEEDGSLYSDRSCVGRESERVYSFRSDGSSLLRGTTRRVEQCLDESESWTRKRFIMLLHGTVTRTEGTKSISAHISLLHIIIYYYYYDYTVRWLWILVLARARRQWGRGCLIRCRGKYWWPQEVGSTVVDVAVLAASVALQLDEVARMQGRPDRTRLVADISVPISPEYSSDWTGIAAVALAALAALSDGTAARVAAVAANNGCKVEGVWIFVYEAYRIVEIVDGRWHESGHNCGWNYLINLK